jgi:hypothetical protein
MSVKTHERSSSNPGKLQFCGQVEQQKGGDNTKTVPSQYRPWDVCENKRRKFAECRQIVVFTVPEGRNILLVGKPDFVSRTITFR